MFRSPRGNRIAVASIALLLAVTAVAGAAERTVTLRIDAATLRWTPSPDGYLVGVEDAVSARIPGSLDLPLLPVTVLSPDGQRLAEVEVLTMSADPVDVPGPIAVVPSEDPPGTAGPASPPQLELIRRAPGGYMRGARVDGFMVAPLRPSGPNGEWELTHRLELRLRFEPDPTEDIVRPLRGRRGVEGRRVPGRLLDLSERDEVEPRTAVDPGFAAADAGAFNPRFNPSLDGSPVEYVIVTGDALAAEFERLADWKTRSGTPTVVRTLEWIQENYPTGADTQERIRAFIRDAVVYWGTEWVLLGGDSAVLPARYGRTTYFGGERIPTDLYFQCLDGGWNADGDENFGEGYRFLSRPGDAADLWPDVWLGRLPVNTVDETRVSVDKVLTYEIEPPVDADYPISNLMLAEVLFPRGWSADDTVLFDGADLAEETIAHFPPEFPSLRLYENHLPFPGAVPETLSTAIAAINQGYGVVNHIGHGYIQNMAVGLADQSIVIADADAFTNGDRTSVLYAINCTAAAFDFDCITEHFLNNPNGGAVASVGATRYDFPGTSHYYCLEFYDLIFDDGVNRVGEAASLAKLPFVSLSVEDNAHRWTQFTLIYFGDPHLRMWTATPQVLTVAHDASLALGEHEIAVTVQSGGAAFADAEVTLYKDGETYATGLTDASGVARIPAHPRTMGDLLVTVTAANALPYLGQITLTAATAGYPLVTAVAVEDSQGSTANGNGNLEAGETGRVAFTLRNEGVASLTGLSVSAADAGPLAFTFDSADATELAAGAEADFTFAVSVAADAGDLLTVPVALAVQADQGAWSPRAVLYVGAPSLAVYDLLITEEIGDDDGEWEGGETLAIVPRILNRGAGAGLSLSGVLTLDVANGATIEGSGIDFGAVGPGEISPDQVATPLLVKLGREGDLPRLKLEIMDALASRLTTSLDLEPPLPPATTTATGAEGYIAVAATPSTSRDVARYVVYRSESAQGPFVRLDDFQDYASAYFVDEPLPGLAVRYYRLAAQDSSGNLSPPGPTARGVTSVPLVSGFPVPAELATHASPLSVDLDGDGRLEMVTGREEIYVVRADGSEARDGDSDPLTLGPWTDVRPQNGFWASPAVADLDGDGRLEVVGLTFTEGDLYVWDHRGRLLPGWPQATDDGAVIAIGSPTLADLTGDGLPEIIVHAGTSLYAFDRFGDEVIDGDDDPSTHGVFFDTGSIYSYGSVGAADFDNDGRAEIVVPVRGDIFATPSRGKVYLLDDDGSHLPGWPITFRGSVTSSPAIADLNKDGVLDIIVGTGSDSVEVRTLNGTSLPGWPQSTLMNQDVMSSPGVADVDRDGSLDVAVISGNGTITLWHADGTKFDGFPYRYADALENPIAARGSPSLVNLDADDDLELLTGNVEGGVIALNHDATIADGFPIQLQGPADGGILVTDLDGDGMNEMGVSCFDRNVYLYRTNGHVVTDTGWPMFRHDPRRTGFLGTPLTEAATPRLYLAVLQSNQIDGLGTVYAVATRDLDGGAAMTLDGDGLTVELVDAERRFYRAPVTLEPGTHVLAASGTAKDGVPGSSEKSFDVLAAPARRGWLTAAGAGVRLWADSAPDWPARLLVSRWSPGDGAAGNDFAPPAAGGVLVQVGPPDRVAPAGTRIEIALPETWEGASMQRWDGGAWRALPSARTAPGQVAAVIEEFGWFRLARGSTAEGRLPVALAVDRPRPNPFAGAARVAFSLSGEGRVRAELFDIRGARVRGLADRVYPAGNHELVWDGRDDFDRPTPAGVYFLRVTGEGGGVTRKLVRVSEGGGR